MSASDDDDDDDTGDDHGEKKPKRLIQGGLGVWPGFSVTKKIRHRQKDILVPLEVKSRVPKLDLRFECLGCHHGFQTSQALGSHVIFCVEAKKQKATRDKRLALGQVHLQFPAAAPTQREQSPPAPVVASLLRNQEANKVKQDLRKNNRGSGKRTRYTFVQKAGIIEEFILVCTTIVVSRITTLRSS
jgi:hypothetical protein